MAKTEEKPRRLRLRHKLLLALALAAALGVSFFLGIAATRGEAQPQITTDLISQRLAGVQELATVEYFYTNMGRFENQLDFYGWAVPLTRKSFIVSYDGTVKAGVDLTDMSVTVNGTTVTVTLPQAKILSHEIPEDSIEIFDETHNIFNPIQISDYTGFTRDQKSDVEARAVENGLLEEASRRARSAVEQLLALVPGMEAYTLIVK